MAVLSVEVTGGNMYKQVLKKLADMKLSVKAGIFANATTTDGKSIAEYAIYNEFGTATVPPRPFMRTTVKDKQIKWYKVITAAVLQGNFRDKATWKRAVVLCGESMKADIQNTIQNGSFAPNAPATVEAKTRKGKVEPDHPLIDTGQMLAAVNYEVIEE